jgi:hypothetical protein
MERFFNKSVKGGKAERGKNEAKKAAKIQKTKEKKLWKN